MLPGLCSTSAVDATVGSAVLGAALEKTITAAMAAMKMEVDLGYFGARIFLAHDAFRYRDAKVQQAILTQLDDSA